MAQEPINPITEDDKRRLTRYLIDRVLEGISGRDGADIVDATPSRTLFAGVLQPSSEREIHAAQRGAIGREAPAGTAVGLDFRVSPASGSKTVTLRITPRFSVYYPVFPSWEEVLRSNQDQITVASLASDAPNKDADPPGPLASLELPGATSGLDDDEEAPEGAGETAAAGGAGVVLPRVFRRFEVVCPTVSLVVTLEKSEVVSIGGEEIAGVLTAARAKVNADPDRWKFLAEPKKRERRLGNAEQLTSSESYAKALTAVKGARVPFPPWSAVLQVDSGADVHALGAIRVRVLLANTTPDRDESVPDPALEERSLFDATIETNIEGGTLLPLEFHLAPKDYRSTPTMPAKGVNCSVRWHPENPTRLETETLPVFSQPVYRTREELEVRFEDLDVAKAEDVLARLADSMDGYLALWDGFLANDAGKRLTEDGLAACRADRDLFAKEIDAYRLGIECLRRDHKLAAAFRLMNRTFARLARASGGKVRAWRLFQLGFIVSQLPALAVRELAAEAHGEYAEQLSDGLNEVAVLWFPTGGGKTEAYLGLISAALLYDRLRGKLRGVTAWMRFPLRMLSLQQLERLARVIAALNQLRAEEPSLGAGDPFAIGYFVGNDVTPNSISEDDMKAYEKNATLREEIRLLRKCPFCGGAVRIEPRRTTWRLAHVCSNPDCFSNTSDGLGLYRGSLPVCVVDNEIYRYLPAVIVGTIDKLAIIGRNRSFVHLVRGVRQQCPTHGYTSYDECIERWSGCKAAKRDLIRLEPVNDPGPALLIQDELHLLREELGVFNGHYEGLLRYLGKKAFLPPKVLAATATIEAYDTQAFHIYLSRARRYPQPAWELGESFYATCKPLAYRRHYVGILCHTRAIEDPVLRLLALYLTEVRRLKSDPNRAAVVMNRQDVSPETVLDTLRLYDLSLVYVNRKATGGSIIDKAQQIEKLLARENLGTLTSSLLTGDQTIEEIGATIERIERERAETGEPRLDLVAATSLISHGIDLERINMMAVCGMPSHYAEYVQTTSRATRSHPGAVFVCFKARDPREISQFEFFYPMHEHLDRLIEAVAVNRFASYAPLKTVPGLLAGVLLCDLGPSLFGSQITKPLNHLPTLQTALGFRPGSATGTQANCLDKTEILKAIEEIIGVDHVRPPASQALVANARKRIHDVFEDLMGRIGRTTETNLSEVLDPLTSFRDVDEGVDFGSLDSAGLVTRLRAR